MPGESNMQQPMGSPCWESNAQGNGQKRFPQYIGSTSTRQPAANGQFYRPDEYPTTWPPNNESFLKCEIENLSSSSARLPTHSFHGNGQLIQMATPETLPVSNRPPQECSFPTHVDAPKGNGWAPNPELGPGSYGLTSLGHTNVVAHKLPPLPPPSSELCNFQAEGLRPLQLLLQRIVQPGGLTVLNGGNTSPEEDKKFGVSCDSNHSNYNDRSLPIEAQVGSTPLSCSYSDFSKESDRSHQDGRINIMKKMEGTDIKNSENFSEDESLPRSSVASTVVEKLWDGSLQLNPSVTVSAVAFFKSGERMPDINWTAFVEVKGKVRLQAFEKYIQDLPRSRTRGLMVVSLCYKTGSSETGLKDMKEVAKKYKEVKKVGRAQLSAGVDLYICPHSNTIITILAKHGFFKGVTATEDDHDSLIGCVVWRKNQATDSNAKKLEGTVALKPQNAASDSGQQETDSSTAQESREPTSVTGTLEHKNIKGHEVEGSTSNSATTRSPFKQLKAPVPKHQLGLEEPPKGSLEPEKPAPPLRSNVIRHDYDDDDLPEFDFGTAGKICQALTCNLYNVVTLDKKLPYNVAQETDRPLPAKGMSFPDHRPDPLLPPGFPPLKKARGCESPAPLPNSEGARRKNLFDDDNEMPEWQPRAPRLEKTLSSSNSVPTSTYGSTHMGHLPFSAGVCPKSSSFPANINLRQAQRRPANGDFPRGSSPPTGFNSNLPLLPLPKASKIKLPVLPSGHSRNPNPSNVKRFNHPNVCTRRDDR